MRWNILDRNMHILASPDTKADASLPIYHDKQVITLQNNLAIGTYDFTVNQQDPDAKTLQLGNYISFVDKYGKTRLYTLMSHDGDEYEQTWHAEDIGLDLINEVADKWKYNEPHTFAWYAENLLLYDSGWSIGINEIGNLTRSLTFDGQSDSVLTRLGDLANQFDGAELDFEVEMSGSAVTKQVINVYKKLGSDLTQQRFVDAVNLKALSTNGSINDLRTAMIGYGDTPESTGEGDDPQPITFTEIEYDDGRYFTKKGSNVVCDRVAGQTWARAGAFDTTNKSALKGYIVGIYTYQTKDPNELLKRTITNLKTVNEPQIGYEADLLDLQADIGDTVQIAHRQYNPPIYLSARVQEVDNCYTEVGQDTGKLGNYQILESQIDPRITEMVNQVAAKSASYVWVRYADDDKGTNMSILPAGKKYVAVVSVKGNATPSDDPADYAGYWLPLGQDGSNGTPGAPGKDGKTPYFHTAYSWSADGTDRFMTVYPGENLLLDTGFNNLPQYWTARAGTVNGTFNGNNIIYCDAQTITGGFIDVLQQPIYDPALTTNRVLPSHWYTLSFYAKGVGQMATYVYGSFVDTGAGSYNDGVRSNYAGRDGNHYWDLTDGWTRHTYTFKSKSSFPATNVQNVLWRLFKGNEVYICMQKLDEGTLATPYTPSPLDDPEGAYPSFIGTYTDYIADDSTDPSKYTWAKLRGEQGQKGDAGKDGVAGKDGKGIKATAITYQASTNGTTTPTGTWSASVPTVAKGSFLWTRTIWTYTDNTTETGYAVAYMGTNGNNGTNGVAGKDGVGIKSTTITYASSASGTTAPTSGWTANPPATSDGHYIWTKTVWTYTDGTNETGYSVGKIGEKGDKGDKGDSGKGIASTIVNYQASSSGTSIPTGTWLASIPAVAANQYLWTRTTWSYTDNTSANGYSVGKMGATGDKGDTGATGNGIKSVVAAYQNATSGTVIPTGSWLSTPPNTPQGQYLWTRNLTTFTNGGTSTSYSVAYSAKDGQKGDKGDPGSKDVPVVTVGTSYPTKPKSGDIFWLTDSDRNVIGYYVYNGSTWVANKIDAKTIAAETFNGLTFNGMTFNGSEFISAFDYQPGVGPEYTGPRYTGSTVIKDGSYKTSFKLNNSAQSGYVLTEPEGFTTALSDKNGRYDKGTAIQIKFDSIYLRNGSTSGFLSADDLEEYGPVVITTTGGGSTWRAAFYKKFHYVWLSGVLYLQAGKNYNITNLGESGIFPNNHRFMPIYPLSSTSQYGMLQISPGGDVHVVNAPITDRYTIEGLHYRVENL